MSIAVSGVTGRLVGDPDLRYTAAGQAVVRFVVATDPARRGRSGPSVWRCTAWNDLAVNIAASLPRGQRVFVQGWLVERTWVDRAGGAHRGIELVVADCGPSLRSSQARLRQTPRGDGDMGEGPGPWAV